MPFIRLLLRTMRSYRVYLLIFLLNNSIDCLQSKLTDNEQEYGIHNVADIISQSQRLLNGQSSNNPANSPIIRKNNQFRNNPMISNNQTGFRPSNWSGLREMKRLDDRRKKYMEYRSRDDDYAQENIKNTNNYQSFRRRSDLDEDYYYSPHYYPSATNPYNPYTAHHLVYPPAVQPVISIPVSTPVVSPAVLATPSPYYSTRYRPAASRHHYHRIYPSTSASNSIRRRLAALPSNSNYDAVPYYPAASSTSAHNSYYYGTGLATNQPPYTYPYHAAAPAYPTAHAVEHEGKEVHSLLPIIAVIGIGAFMIPLLTTFFTAMMSTGGSCCGQRQKERANNPSDAREPFYERMKDVWRQVEKAINSQW